MATRKSTRKAAATSTAGKQPVGKQLATRQATGKTADDKQHAHNPSPVEEMGAEDESAGDARRSAGKSKPVSTAHN